MIRRVVVRDYQSIRLLDLELAPGVNLVVGPTDSGKSALVRALRDALWGGARGSGHVRSGAKHAEVDVVLGGGDPVSEPACVVGWRKGPGGETLGCNAEDVVPRAGRVWRAMGRTDVPLAGFRAVPLDRGYEVRLGHAGQHEPPFLLDAPGAQVAKALGRLSGVHVVYAAQRAATADLQRLRREAEQARAQADQEAAQAEAIAGPAERAQAAAERVRGLVGRAGVEQASARRLRVVADRLEAIDRDDPAARAERLDHAEELLRRSVDEVQRVVVRAERLGDIAVSVERLMRAEASARLIASSAEAAQREVAALLAAIKTCPTCGQEWHPKGFGSETIGGPRCPATAAPEKPASSSSATSTSTSARPAAAARRTRKR